MSERLKIVRSPVRSRPQPQTLLLLKIGIEKSDYEDIDSVGGLMAQKLGRVPIAGSTISWEGWAITSERPLGRRRRISSVLVERLEEEIEDAE